MGKYLREKNNPQQESSKTLRVKRTERKKVVKTREKTRQEYRHASIDHLFPPS